MKYHLPSSVQDAVDGGQLPEIILYPFDDRHCLTVFILHHDIVFQGFRENFHLGHLLQGLDSIVLGIEDLSAHRRNFQFGVEGREHGSNQILKTVEDGQSTHQCQCGESYSTHRHPGYHINRIVRFLGKQIPLGNIEGEVHSYYFFNNSSMRST